MRKEGRKEASKDGDDGLLYFKSSSCCLDAFLLLETFHVLYVYCECIVSPEKGFLGIAYAQYARCDLPACLCVASASASRLDTDGEGRRGRRGARHGRTDTHK